jgi:hypothetical protein
MQQDWKLVFACEFELRGKQGLLALHIQAFHKEIETNLTDRDGALGCKPLIQLIQILRPMIFEVDRMQTVCRHGLWNLMAGFLHIGKGGRGNRGNHDLIHASRTSRRNDRITIRRKLGDVEVTMGID